ncbi:MAG: lamin tail domain-containing protein [Candidatus Buchananbacteria bacterium]|nr:lamin tail domain-containing protein [Candidatus Buchananbacteria bacterium]
MKSEKYCAKKNKSKSKKKKNKHFSLAGVAVNYGLKFLSFVLVVLVANLTLLKAGVAQAYFNDGFEPASIAFTAGTLSFVATGSDFSANITPIENSISTVTMQNTGTLDFIYQVQIANVATSTFCGALELKDNISGVFMPLSSYVSATSSFSILPAVSLEVRLVYSDQLLIGKSCQFDLVFTGWQTDFVDATLGFSDTKTVSVIITAGEWLEDPSFSPTVVADDVIINELMWMGSNGDLADEWLELRNTTNYNIDISGWQLTNLIGASNTENLMITIPNGKVIPANSFFLISNYSEASSSISVIPDLVNSDLVLRDTDLKIRLYKDSWLASANLIDTAGDGSGATLNGSSTNFYSMARNNFPRDGVLAANWHTYIEASSTVLYWDVGRTERGTPGASNFAEEDGLIIEEPIIIEEPLIDETATTTEEIIQENEPVEETADENNPLDTEVVIDNPDSPTSEESDLSENEAENPSVSESSDDQAPAELVDESLLAITNKSAEVAPVTPVPDGDGSD